MEFDLKLALVVPDTHVKTFKANGKTQHFHDPKAVGCVGEVAAFFKFDRIDFLGDFWDCYAVSAHSKDPQRDYDSLAEEVIPGQKILRQITEASGAKEKNFIEGNHEYRVERYIHANAPKLTESVSTRDLLGVPKDFKYIPFGQKSVTRMGDLLITHGTLCGKYPAEKMVSKYGHNVMFGHTHKIQTHQKTIFGGQTFTGYNIGWLGDSVVAGDYVKDVTDWAQGFAIVYYNEKTGEFFPSVIKIINGKCVVNGKVFKG